MTELERYKEAVKVAIFSLRSLGLDHAHLAHAIEERINEVLNPPPETETVEIERWSWGGCVSTYDTEEQARAEAIDTDTVVKLTGTLTRPKPVKVERSVRLVFSESGIWSWPDGHPDLCGKSCILTYMD